MIAKDSVSQRSLKFPSHVKVLFCTFCKLDMYLKYPDHEPQKYPNIHLYGGKTLQHERQ